MSFKETAEQFTILQAQISGAAREAFDKFSEAGLIREERHEDGEYKKVPVKGYKYESFEIYPETVSPKRAGFIEIRGEQYAGCGEYDHTTIHIPLEAMDNLDEYIAGEQAKIAEEERKAAEAKAEAERQRQLLVEKSEREQFERLSKKFGGAA